MIPPWSGSDGFHGYAEECAAENQICWPMPNHDQLVERIERAREFWRSCQSADDHPFAELQKQILDSYRSVWGRESGYFAIDGGQFPPRGLATFEREGHFVAATVGMSLCPQPMVEMQVEDPRELSPRRIGDRTQQRPGARGKKSDFGAAQWAGENAVAAMDLVGPDAHLRF